MGTRNGDASMKAFFDAIRQTEQERGSKIWCMIHTGPAHICYPTVWALYRGRNTVGTGEKVEILLHSPGGHPDIAYRTMKFFRRRFAKVNIIVPLEAKSAATLMCLGADQIFMGEMADLGPIDIQIDDEVNHGGRGFSPLDEFKSIEYMRDQAIEWMDYYAKVMNIKYQMSIKEALKDSIPLVTGLMQPVFEQIDPIEMGTNRRALAISEEYAKRMLTLVEHDDPRSLVKQLVWDYPSHDFCIDFEEAKGIGLPVEKLSEAQDRRLAEAIINLERDAYHGFVPQPQAQATSARRSRRPVRTTSSRPERRVNGQAANGRNGPSAGERVRT